MREREIKFRVWDVVTKQMLDDFSLFGEVTLLGGIHEWQSEEAALINVKRDLLGALNDLVVMQFTGLRDKNGKEIYEGDILAKSSDHTFRYVVKYMTNRARFMLSCTHRRQLLALTDQVARKEVIGNIYQPLK